MAKGPSDEIDVEDYDDLEAYIADAMAEGWTLEAEDFEGRQCAYCGDLIPFVDWPEGVVTWDTEVVDPDTGETEPYIQRDYFCSEGCRHDAKRDAEWLQNPQDRPDEGDRIHVDDVDGRV